MLLYVGGPSRGALRLLRSSRAPSCDFASQSSSLRSSGDLTASPQVHPALTRPDTCGAGASRDGHSLRLHSPAADPSRVHLFDRFSRDRQCRAGGSHIIPDRTRKAQDTAIRPQAANRQNGSITSAQTAAGPERQNGGIVRSSPSVFCVISCPSILHAFTPLGSALLFLSPETPISIRPPEALANPHRLPVEVL